MRLPRLRSLKARLGIGAALLGAGTLLIAMVLYLGLNAVAQRLDAALASEMRISRYSTLSTQASTFLVVATEAIQTGQNSDSRADRLAPVAAQMRETFERLDRDVEVAVTAAQDLGLDAQSRYGTQSLGLARMQARLDATLAGLADAAADADTLRAYLDSFASSVDQLLNQAVHNEGLFRSTILAGIDDLRQRLTLIALIIVAATVLAVATFYLLLIQPQFTRLDRLRDAALRIGQEDFSVALPVTRDDEIGRLSAETNRAAAALRVRQTEVRTEWNRLNATIAERTDALRAANASLEDIDAKRRRFFADISHELRTPLTVILMEAQIGRQGTPDPGAAFATIEARAARLNRRIDDLLRLARSDTGQLALEPEPTSLPSLLDDISAEVRAEFDNAGMTLTTAAAPGATLVCDPNWLRQVVVSLLRNAIRHARSGGAAHLSAEVGPDSAEISVTDNGPGIPAQDQTRVFDRFAQGSSATAHQGFGMGLALAKWVIEEQGGRIELLSPLSGDAALGAAPGTKIAVRLPLAAR